MHKIEWSDAYNVGVSEIDYQHKRLFKLLNDLVETDDLHVRSEEISKALYGIIDYADEHFKAEEAYMQKINYPKFTEHKKEHTLFRRMAVQFCQETIDHKKDVPQEMITFLAEWTIGHVLFADQDYKNFVDETNKVK